MNILLIQAAIGFTLIGMLITIPEYAAHRWARNGRGRAFSATREDYTAMGLNLLLAAGLAGLLWWQAHRGLGFWLGIGILALLAQARYDWGRARSRGFGLRLEAQALASLGSRLPGGWRLRTDVNLGPPVGNVDGLVTTARAKLYSLEIKSYGRLVFDGQGRAWRLTRRGRLPVEKDILGQCHAQRRALGYGEPVLWLPQARSASAEWVRGVYVVHGDADDLIRALQGREWQG